MGAEVQEEVPVLVAGAGPAGLAPRRPSPATGWGRWSWSAGPACPACRGRPRSARGRWSCCRSWGLEERDRAGGVDVEWQLGGAATRWRPPRPARRAAVGYPTREQSARHQPGRAGLRAAGPPRAGAAAPTCARCRPARVELGTEVGRPRRRPGGRPRDAARHGDGHRPGRWTPRYVVAGRRRAQRRAARARHPDARPGRPRRRRSPRCSARRCGISSARAATASTSSSTPAPAACFLPAGPGDRWLYGVGGYGPSARARRRSRRARPARLIRHGDRRRRPRAADRAHRHVHLRRAARRALPGRAGCSSWATPPTGSRRAAARA